MNVSLHRPTNPDRLIPAILLLAVIPFIIVEIFHSSLYFRINIEPYLVFHNSAEFFSIVVSLSIFGLGWFSYGRSKDQHVFFLSAAFLAIGLMDFMHTLGYAGMPEFITPNHPSKSSQYWIAVRTFSAAAFLASGFIYEGKTKRWLNRTNLIIAAFAVSGLVFTGITFFPEYIPATFVEGKGLTRFKKNSEYLIILLLLIAFAVYWRRMRKTGNRLIIYYLAAFLLCILSELVFTFYTSAFDTYNMMGHIYKVIAFYLIYKALFVHSVKIPYNSLRVEIAEHKRAEEIIKESLREKETLIRELYHRTKNTMQVILGMIVLQSVKYPANEEIQSMVKNTDSRIQVISLVHQMLYRSKNLSQISIREYIYQLSDLIIENSGISTEKLTLKINVDDHCFLLDMAIPFGLIINEIMTNSLKHAFPDGRNAIITITLAKNGSGKNILRYSDNGIGVSDGFDFRNSGTLGLRLIFSLGEQQMLGRVEMVNNDGVTCVIEFPDNLYQARV